MQYLVAFSVIHAGGHVVSSIVMAQAEQPITETIIERWASNIRIHYAALDRPTVRILSFQRIGMN